MGWFPEICALKHTSRKVWPEKLGKASSFLISEEFIDGLET